MARKTKTQEGLDKRGQAMHAAARPSPPIYEYPTREEVLAILSKAGASIREPLLTMLRLPPSLVRGIHEELEFFDLMSIQPAPYGPKDSPSSCYDNGLPAPSWIKERYLAVTLERGKRYVVAVDASRNAFVKEELADQDQAAFKLYRIMMAGRAP